MLMKCIKYVPIQGKYRSKEWYTAIHILNMWVSSLLDFNSEQYLFNSTQNFELIIEKKAK